MPKEHSRDEGLTWAVFLDVTSSELVNGAKKEGENPLTYNKGLRIAIHNKKVHQIVCIVQ